jgi:dipeptidyl aminopeptidase/acylaminoacyl peptidase
VDGGRQTNHTSLKSQWILSSSGGEPVALTRGNQDDTTFIVARVGWVVYSSHIEGTGRYDVWRTHPEEGVPERITDHPGVNVPVAVGPDGRVFYFHSDPAARGDLWVTEKQRVRPKRLTHTDRMGFADLINKPEPVMLPNVSDRNLCAQIYRPSDFDPTRKHPAIVWIKGGPTGRLQFSYAPLCSYLANLGYVVGTVAYRGCTGFGVEHTWSDREGLGVSVSDLADVLALADFVKSLPEVQSGKMGVGGSSWGGYLTLRCVTQTPDRFAYGAAHGAI